MSLICYNITIIHYYIYYTKVCNTFRALYKISGQNSVTRTVWLWPPNKGCLFTLKLKKRTSVNLFCCQVPVLWNTPGLQWQYLWANASIMRSIFWASPGSLKLHRNCRRAWTRFRSVNSCNSRKACRTLMLKSSLHDTRKKSPAHTPTGTRAHQSKQNKNWIMNKIQLSLAQWDVTNQIETD